LRLSHFDVISSSPLSRCEFSEVFICELILSIPCHTAGKHNRFDITTQYPHVLGWGENGESILVHDLKALETTVLLIYFRHGNYRSFVRQLNLYEFRKDNNRKNIEYRHPEVSVKVRVEKSPLRDSETAERALG